MVRFKEVESPAAQVIREANERVEESIADGARLIEEAGQAAWERLIRAVNGQPRERPVACRLCDRTTWERSAYCDTCLSAVMDQPAGVGGAAEIPTCPQHPGVELDDDDRCRECEPELTTDYAPDLANLRAADRSSFRVGSRGVLMSADYRTELEEGLRQSLDGDLDSLFETWGQSEAETGRTFEGGSLFQITDESSADWALRKHAQAVKRSDEIAALAADEIARITAWHDEESEKHERTIAFMEQLLGTYHRKVLAEDPSRKSIKLPHGTLKSRQQQAAFTFSPEFIEWAIATAPDLVRMKYETEAVKAKAALVPVPIDGELIAHFDGEPVPGVAIEPAVVKFTVSTDGAK